MINGITWITEGSAEVTSQGKTFIVKAGAVIIFPAKVVYLFRFLLQTLNLRTLLRYHPDFIRVSRAAQIIKIDAVNVAYVDPISSPSANREERFGMQ